MCMEDIRIGRVIKGTESLVTLTNASQLVVQADPKRVHLRFYPPVSGTVTISVHDPVVANVGITMTANDHPLDVEIEHQGDLTFKSWFAIHSVGGVTLAIHEGQLLLE